MTRLSDDGPNGPTVRPLRTPPGAASGECTSGVQPKPELTGPDLAKQVLSMAEEPARGARDLVLALRLALEGADDLDRDGCVALATVADLAFEALCKAQISLRRALGALGGVA